MRALDVFPTKFFEFNIDRNDAYNVINEILRNREQIKTISSTTQPQSTDVYQTDFCDPIKLETFEQIIQNISSKFAEYNSTFVLKEYWTAIYKSFGWHNLHNHNYGITDTINYSGILYLSDIGSTTFFSDSPTSFESSVNIQSQTGKIIFFPAKLPHVYEPTLVEANERFVVPFNGSLTNV
jgi:hypothetical protein